MYWLISWGLALRDVIFPTAGFLLVMKQFFNLFERSFLVKSNWSVAAWNSSAVRIFIQHFFCFSCWRCSLKIILRLSLLFIIGWISEILFDLVWMCTGDILAFNIKYWKNKNQKFGEVLNEACPKIIHGRSLLVASNILNTLKLTWF